MWRKVSLISLILMTTLPLPGCCFLHPGFRSGDNPATFYIHTSIPSSWHNHIDAGANGWNLWGIPQFYIQNGGVTSAGGSFTSDGIRSIFRTTFPDNRILAEARPTNIGVCFVDEQEVGFNINQPWTTDPISNSHSFDVQSVAVHEFGHWLVLLHVICPGDSVMKSSLAPGEVTRDLTICDAFGLLVIYYVLPPCFPFMAICFDLFFSPEATNSTQAQASQLAANYHDELMEIYRGNADVQNKVDSLSKFYQPIIEDWLNGGNLARNTIFTNERYQEIDQLISLVYTDSSDDLKGALNDMRSSIQRKIGWTIEDFLTDQGQQPLSPKTTQILERLRGMQRKK